MKSKKITELLTLVLVATMMFMSLQGAMVGIPSAQAASSQYPTWSASDIYTGGQRVVYNGSVYEALWWTQGDNPTSPANPDSNPWKFIGPLEPGEEETTTTEEETTTGEETDPIYKYPAWNSQATYFMGDRIVYNGMAYEALYWSQSEAPDTSSAWILLGPGEATTSTDPSIDNPVIGEGIVLTDAEILEKWDGIDDKYSPANAEIRLEQYLSQADFEALFPRRFGSPMWHATNPVALPPGTTVPEYYSYDNLKAAMKHIANIKYKIEYREGAAYATKISVLNKATKTETVISMNPDFNGDWNLTKPIVAKIVDFGSFLADGTENDKKREIAGFLANIAHETGGGWATAPDGPLAWGLYYNEEVSYTGTNQIGYVDSGNTAFPPAPGKSYHGRGPIQLSWNYNYGLISGILYQDINVLLNNPELVTADGKLGFMTALLFWMTPQPPKPSCHDVMTGIWTPTADDIAKGITEPGFGCTINIINGGFEAGLSEADYRVGRRVGHYRDITSKNGADITGEKLDTLGMQTW